MCTLSPCAHVRIFRVLSGEDALSALLVNWERSPACARLWASGKRTPRISSQSVQSGRGKETFACLFFLTIEMSKVICDHSNTEFMLKNPAHNHSFSDNLRTPNAERSPPAAVRLVRALPVYCWATRSSHSLPASLVLQEKTLVTTCSFCLNNLLFLGLREAPSVSWRPAVSAQRD